MASKCISEFTGSWSPCASMNLLDQGLEVHLQGVMGVYGDTVVPDVDYATGSIYSGHPSVDRHHLIFISSYHSTKIYTLFFPTFVLTCSCLRFHQSTQLRGPSRPGSIIFPHAVSTLLEPELLNLNKSIWMLREVQRNIDGWLSVF